MADIDRDTLAAVAGWPPQSGVPGGFHGTLSSRHQNCWVWTEKEVSQGVLSKLNWIVQISGDIRMRILLYYFFAGTGSTNCEAHPAFAGTLQHSGARGNICLARHLWVTFPLCTLLPLFTMATIMCLAQRFPPYQRDSPSQDLGLVCSGRGWEEDTGLSAGLRNVSGVKEII